MPTVSDICRIMDAWAPEALAESWDNVGLLVGDPQQPVEGVLATLDVTDAVIEEAVERKCQLILAHHPFPMRPVKQVRTDDPAGRKLAVLLRQRISLYACHTNFDHAPQGGGAVLAERLGLQQVTCFAPTSQAGDVKIAVFTPAQAVEPVLRAMAEAGAGVIGAYSHCSFRCAGTGTYLPLAGAHPYAGEVGRLEQAEELRLEVVAPRHRWPEAVEAARRVHPYEEMAYDVYPLENQVALSGAGRVGDLRPPTTLLHFIRQVKHAWGISTVRFVGDPQRPVQRVALWGGSGGGFIRQAYGTGADVYVTGDLTHHQALDAYELGLAVVDASHAGIERVFIAAWIEHLQKCLPKIRVYPSEQDNDPLRSY